MAKTPPAPKTAPGAPSAPTIAPTFKRVPFNELWTTHDKLDIKGIYRRPRYVEDRYGEMQRELVDGIPTWDVTTALPIRSHAKWASRGFQFITLATLADLLEAHRKGSLLSPDKQGLGDPRDYINHRVGGPWNAVVYLEVAAKEDQRAHEELAEMVFRFGADAVTDIRRADNPYFDLPDSLKGLAAGERAK